MTCPNGTVCEKRHCRARVDVVVVGKEYAGGHADHDGKGHCPEPHHGFIQMILDKGQVHDADDPDDADATVAHANRYVGADVTRAAERQQDWLVNHQLLNALKS